MFAVNGDKQGEPLGVGRVIAPISAAHKTDVQGTGIAGAHFLHSRRLPILISRNAALTFCREQNTVDSKGPRLLQECNMRNSATMQLMVHGTLLLNGLHYVSVMAIHAADAAHLRRDTKALARY